MADLEFTAEVVPWRGPAPFHFVITPPAESAWLREAGQQVSYGWGMVPVTGWIGRTEFTTALWPRRDGAYWVPLKDAVRAAEQIELGDLVTVALSLRGG